MGVRYFTAGYCGTTRSSRGYPEGEEYSPRGADAAPRSGGRSIWSNNLDGTLPAELGKLPDLERLCAAVAAAAQPIGGTGRRRAHAPAVVRSECSENKLSGTIGSWIGSMAKLTKL